MIEGTLSDLLAARERRHQVYDAMNLVADAGFKIKRPGADLAPEDFEAYDLNSRVFNRLLLEFGKLSDTIYAAMKTAKSASSLEN